MEIKTDAKLIRKILGSAAYLVAAMRDPNGGLVANSLLLEVKDSLDYLQDELNQAGLLAAYKRDNGSLGI